MRAVIQRVAEARVTVDDRAVGAIGRGLLVFLGIAADDAEEDAQWLLDKLLDLRIFENELGKFDRSVRDVNGELLVVSQFTLYADTRKGRRPSFTAAARPEHAIPLYEGFVAAARRRDMRVATGDFGAHMHVELINDGPVTLTLTVALGEHMPGAGFYAIHTKKISFRSDGRWYADEDPVVHERLARFFSRYLRRKSSTGYEIWVDERYHADVEIEDTPYVVTSVHTDADGPVGGLSVELSDDTTEPLNGDSLEIGSDNVLYCTVKQGTERARFLRPAYYQLTNFIEEPAPGRFLLRCGRTTHTITQR